MKGVLKEHLKITLQPKRKVCAVIATPGATPDKGG